MGHYDCKGCGQPNCVCKDDKPKKDKHIWSVWNYEPTLVSDILKHHGILYTMDCERFETREEALEECQILIQAKIEDLQRKIRTLREKSENLK